MTGESRIELDAEAIEELARQIDSLADTVDHEIGRLRNRAVAALGAIPVSDLHHAFGYCWGRWSLALLGGRDELSDAANVARRAADGWRTTEQDRVRATAEAGRTMRAQP